MSTRFTQTKAEIKREPQDIKEMQVTRLDGGGEMSIHSFDPERIERPGGHDYKAVKAKFGSLAATDTDRTPKARKDARFALSPLLRDPLSVEAEERRAIDERVDKTIEEISVQAKLDAEKAGYQAGLERGRNEAMAMHQKDSAEKLAHLETLLREMESARGRIFKENEELILTMVYRICRRILLREVKEDREYLRRLCQTLIEKLDTRENIVICLNPEDRENIGALKKGLEQELGAIRNLSIEVSDKVPRGGCVVESEWGLIEASLDTQLETLHNAATDAGKS